MLITNLTLIKKTSSMVKSGKLKKRIGTVTAFFAVIILNLFNILPIVFLSFPKTLEYIIKVTNCTQNCLISKFRPKNLQLSSLAKTSNSLYVSPLYSQTPCLPAAYKTRKTASDFLSSKNLQNQIC